MATTYLNGPGIDNHLRQTSATTGVSYYLTDHLGSTAGLTGTTGNLLELETSDSFGNSAGSARTRYLYTGRERDPDTGQLYYRARWYDPQVGRFISEDPIGFGGGDVNLYGYVWQSPLGYRDPLGYSGWGSDYADWLDRQIEGVRSWLQPDPYAVDWNTAINFGANILHGSANMYRLGNGIGNAWWNPCPADPLGDVLEDVGRGAGIVLAIAGPAAGATRGAGAAANAGMEGGIPGGPGLPPVRMTPSFLGQESGPSIPIPRGATGPQLLANGKGVGYTGGSGGNGLAPSVSNVRIMDPTLPKGPSPGYPNGYVNYSNGAAPTPQSVNPVTGQTVGRYNPWWHIPLGP